MQRPKPCFFSTNVPGRGDSSGMKTVAQIWLSFFKNRHNEIKSKLAKELLIEVPNDYESGSKEGSLLYSKRSS